MTTNIIGKILGRNLTMVSKDKVLNKNTGIVSKVQDVLKQTPLTSLTSSSSPVIVAKQVEVVVGIDGKRIDFTLASSEGVINPLDGYLIEVYESGSDGILTRVFQEDVVDVVNDKTLSQGFSGYLVLQLDVTGSQ